MEQQQQAGIDLPAQVSALKTWLLGSRNVQPGQIKLDASAGLYSSIEDLRLTESVQAGQVSFISPQASRSSLLHYSPET